MKHLDLFSGIGGFALAASWVWSDEYENVGHSEVEKSACGIYHHHFKESDCLGDIRRICSLPLASLARTLHLQEQLLVGEKDLPVSEQDCFDSWQSLLQELAQNGLSSKMFPDFLVRTRGEIWRSSSRSFPKSGIAWRGECLTLNSSESPSVAVVCGLSEVLETGGPTKYYLSNRAIAGMLRRSIRYGRSGYVFLQETEKGKTPRLKTLSLQSLLQLITGKSNTENTETSATLSDTQLQAALEELLHTSQTKILLRRLTPKEKERLMGFPIGWTLDGKDSHRGKGLGNAIVPQCAAVIMERIKIAMKGA